MELFHGRPMVFIGGAAIAAALCGWYFDGCIKLVLAAAVLSAFVLCALLRIFGKLSRRHAVTLLLGFAAAFCVLLRAYAYFDLQYLGSESLCDSEHDIYMTVEERMTSGAVGTRYRVKIERIDGEAPSSTTRAWLECAYSAVEHDTRMARMRVQRRLPPRKPAVFAHGSGKIRKDRAVRR